MSKFSKEVIKQIKKEHGCPISKWCFVVKRALVLTAFIVSTILAAFVFSVILARFIDLDWGVDLQCHGFSFVVYAFPCLWLVLAIIAIIGAYFYFKKTPRGYTHRCLTIISALFAVTFIAGILLYILNLPKSFDITVQNSSVHKILNYDKYSLWNRPNEGFLSGEIVDSAVYNKILLKDFDSKLWVVDVSGAVIIDEDAELKIGEKVKITGISFGEEFVAREIRAWDHY